MANDFRLLITGASRGLGKALALRFSRLGYQLILTARTEGALGELSDEITASGGLRPGLVALDLLDVERIDGIGATIAKRYGGLDGVILNAGYLGFLSPTEHGDSKLWQEVFTVNVLANQILLRCLHSLLLRGCCGVGGIVVGVTCDDYRGASFWGCYGASKAAFEIMLRCYSKESCKIGAGKDGSSMGLRVHCIDPGRMSTSLRRCAFPGEDDCKYPITDRTLEPFIDALCDK